MSGDHNMYASGSGDGQRSGWRKRQVLDMAEKASPSKQDWWKDDDALEAFAKLVREDEREACAKVCETLWDTPSNGMATEEQCYGDECAAAILARGQA